MSGTEKLFGLIVIGDEILSGRRTDKHLPKMLEHLNARGLKLAWAQYVGDEPDRIVEILKQTFSKNEIVFCTGGIGATPDDHTRACVAKALGLELALHPQAKELIAQRIIEMAEGDPVKSDLSSKDNAHRFKMGEFPIGSHIIPNTYNRIPGFFIQEHYFMPGFPVMADPMMSWVLDTFYSQYFHKTDYIEKSFIVLGAIEATITPVMEEVEGKFPGIKVFSLPSLGDSSRGGIYASRHIELGVKGSKELVEAALKELRNGVEALNSITYDIPA